MKTTFTPLARQMLKCIGINLLVFTFFSIVLSILVTAILFSQECYRWAALFYSVIFALMAKANISIFHRKKHFFLLLSFFFIVISNSKFFLVRVVLTFLEFAGKLGDNFFHHNIVTANFAIVSTLLLFWVYFVLVHLIVFAMVMLVDKISKTINLLVERHPRLKKLDEKIVKKSKKERFFYAVCVFLIIVACGKLYFILLNKTYEYKGTIFSSSTEISSEGGIPSKLNFFFINPRNFKDYINIDMTRVLGKEWKVISLPVFEKDTITFLATDRQHRVFAWKITKHKKESVPLPGIVNEEGLMGSLYKVDHFWFYAYKNFVYKIDETTKTIKLVAKNKDENSRLLPLRDNIAYVEENGFGRFLLKKEKMIIAGEKILGYYVQGQEFLVNMKYDRGTYLADGKEMPRKYSSEYYRILANGPDVTIMLMLASNPPERRSFEYEFTFLDMIRTDWRVCGHPFIYNTKLNDVVNLPLAIEGMKQDYSAYFAEDYNRETLEALRETMYRTDSNFVENE